MVTYTQVLSGVASSVVATSGSGVATGATPVISSAGSQQVISVDVIEQIERFANYLTVVLYAAHYLMFH
jgi:hypothetical protein